MTKYYDNYKQFKLDQNNKIGKYIIFQILKDCKYKLVLFIRHACSFLKLQTSNQIDSNYNIIEAHKFLRKLKYFN